MTRALKNVEEPAKSDSAVDETVRPAGENSSLAKGVATELVISCS